jgi:hypothetical protein
MTDELRFHRWSVANDDETVAPFYSRTPKSNHFQVRKREPNIQDFSGLVCSLFAAAALTTAAPSSDKAALEP